MSDDQNGIYKQVSTLGKVSAIALTILTTPAVYEVTKPPLLSYFSKTWGRAVAEWLVILMGVIEAYMIYALVSLAITSGVVWLIVTSAMRRFRGR